MSHIDKSQLRFKKKKSECHTYADSKFVKHMLWHFQQIKINKRPIKEL